MVRQYLSNTNESAKVSIFQNLLKLNKALIYSTNIVRICIYDHSQYRRTDHQLQHNFDLSTIKYNITLFSDLTTVDTCRTQLSHACRTQLSGFILPAKTCQAPVANYKILVFGSTNLRPQRGYIPGEVTLQMSSSRLYP